MLDEDRTNSERLTNEAGGDALREWVAETIRPDETKQPEQPQPEAQQPETQQPSRLVVLVEASRAGDQAAFGQLYKEFAGLVVKVVRDNLRDLDLVADAVQESFARALQSLDKLRDPERFRQWLLQIARHTAVDIRRDRARYVYSEPEDDAMPDSANDPADVTALREIAGLVNGLVAGLSRRDAVALRLVTLGFDVADVARVLGVRHGAAKVVLHRARRRLRAALVLQLLSNGSTTTCGELPEILETQGIAAAGKHAETCEVCSTSARKAIYG